METFRSDPNVDVLGFSIWVMMVVHDEESFDTVCGKRVQSDQLLRKGGHVNTLFYAHDHQCRQQGFWLVKVAFVVHSGHDFQLVDNVVMIMLASTDQPNALVCIEFVCDLEFALLIVVDSLFHRCLNGSSRKCARPEQLGSLDEIMIVLRSFEGGFSTGLEG